MSVFTSVLGAVLTIKICIILGSSPQHLISDLDLFLPLFMPCLMVGTLLRNLQQQGEFPGFRSSSRTPDLRCLPRSRRGPSSQCL